MSFARQIGRHGGRQCEFIMTSIFALAIGVKHQTAHFHQHIDVARISRDTTVYRAKKQAFVLISDPCKLGTS